MMKTKINGVNLLLYEYNTLKDNVKAVHRDGFSVLEIAKKENSQEAHNFSFANTTSGVPIGNIYIEGEETNKNIAKTTLRESFIINDMDEVSIGYPNEETYYSLQGSPRLLVSGVDVLSKSIIRDETSSDIANSKAIRVAIGIKDKHTFLVIHTLDEITLSKLTEIFVSLGIKDAINGDGGGSSYPYPYKTGWGRKLGSALLINKGAIKKMTNYSIIVDHIPVNTPKNRRPKTKLAPTSITIHNTGNPTSTAKNERAWLTNTSNDRTASYHTVIDDKFALEVLPSNEIGWHAGDGSKAGSGNMSSFGIEICESGNYTQTVKNAIDYTARKLIEFGLTPNNLKRHYDWSGKICPRLMYDSGSWATWLIFKENVRKKYEELKGVSNVSGINIVFEGKKVTVDNKVENGTTWIPLRPALEGMGFKVDYNSTTKTATITKK